MDNGEGGAGCIRVGEWGCRCQGGREGFPGPGLGRDLRAGRGREEGRAGAGIKLVIPGKIGIRNQKVERPAGEKQGPGNSNPARYEENGIVNPFQDLSISQHH